MVRFEPGSVQFQSVASFCHMLLTWKSSDDDDDDGDNDNYYKDNSICNNNSQVVFFLRFTVCQRLSYLIFTIIYEISTITRKKWRLREESDLSKSPIAGDRATKNQSDPILIFQNKELEIYIFFIFLWLLQCCYTVTILSIWSSLESIFIRSWLY